ncbi:MAG TPA: hypothetical protein VIK60_09610 [Vicinamibacterales bacterium]
MTLRGQGVTLTVAGVGAALVVAVLIARGDEQTPVRPGATTRPSNRATASREASLSDVKLELLRRPPATLEEPDRNPFRFESKPAPAEAPPAPRPPVNAPPSPRVVTPTGPPPPPPIPLRFIGLVDAPSQAGRVAIMSDGRGNVFSGKEGDTIEGRYKMLKISPEVVELSYVDGRGRQTIRLSGQ